MIPILRRLSSRNPLIILPRVYFGLLRFPLPDLGEKIKEGRVKKLYVKEGDKVDEFEKIADVESDKQFTEITSPESGIIKKIHYKEDQVCGVGDILLEMDVPGSGESSPSGKSATKVGTAASQKEEKNESEYTKVFAPVFQPVHMSLIDDGVLASATVRMYAREYQIDLKTVVGTGRKGRILKEDILGHIEAVKQGKAPTKLSDAPIAKIVPPIPEVVPPAAPYRVQMSAEEKQMAEAVTYANSIPHLYYTQLFDLTEIVKISENLSKQHKTVVSPLSLLIKCFSMALLSYPRLNSTYSIANPYEFTKTNSQNLLLGTGQQQSSLRLQLLTDLQSLTAVGIQQALTTSSITTSHEAQQHSTICFTDIGSLGGNAMNPLILHQATTHATLGAIRTLPHPFQPRKVAEVTLGCDHRVIDGATAARFTTLWRSYSEDPNLVFAHMA